MTTRRCPFCDGTGRYASALTNWDGVPCDRCNGTGDRPADFVANDALRRAALRETGVLASRRMLAELDAEPMLAGGMR